MCTVTFIPSGDGFLFAMNRDEQLFREQASAPAVFQLGSGQALYPCERSGGSWIGVNDFGIVAAVLNQSIPVEFKKNKSRGMLIPALLKAKSLSELDACMEAGDIIAMLPFRAIVVVRADRRIIEYDWDGQRLNRRSLPWTTRHWFSSGLSDEKATLKRASVCKYLWKMPDAGSLPWLRRLHRSHRPQGGAFSVCVHREDARTVSYTEVECNAAVAIMRYRPGSPCRPAETTEYKLSLRQTFSHFSQTA